MNTLILYYTDSYKTARVARLIADTINAETELIVLEKPYTDADLMNRSREEILSGKYPAIKPLKHDLSQYDTIVLATPTWWVAPASPIYSLIETGALKGKDVYPVITTGFDVHGVEDKLNCALETSHVHKALIVVFANAMMETSEDEIIAYAKDIK